MNIHLSSGDSGAKVNNNRGIPVLTNSPILGVLGHFLPTCAPDKHERSMRERSMHQYTQLIRASLSKYIRDVVAGKFLSFNANFSWESLRAMQTGQGTMFS